MIEVIINGQGLGQIIVDRKDLSENVKGLTLQHLAGEVTSVVVELAATDAYAITLKNTDVAYGLGEPVRRLLDALEQHGELDDTLGGTEVNAAAAALRQLLPVEPTA